MTRWINLTAPAAVVMTVSSAAQAVQHLTIPEAQKQAFDYGVKASGCSVHFVDEFLDHGAIIVQKVVPVLPDDDDHTLAARILEQEHQAYTEAINIVLSGNYEVIGRRVVAR